MTWWSTSLYLSIVSVMFSTEPLRTNVEETLITQGVFFGVHTAIHWGKWRKIPPRPQCRRKDFLLTFFTILKETLQDYFLFAHPCILSTLFLLYFLPTGWFLWISSNALPFPQASCGVWSIGGPRRRSGFLPARQMFSNGCVPVSKATTADR